MFDKELYWKEKENNIGSKRPKPNFTEIAGKHIRQFKGKLIILNRTQDRSKQPDIRNTKKHRDQRTSEKCNISK